MGKSSKILTNTLIILLLLGAAYLGYSYFFDGFSFSFTATPDAESPTAASYPEFVSLLSDLRDIDLDEGDLSARTLASLKDFSIEMPSRLVGRLNPFAPIGTANRLSGGSLLISDLVPNINSTTTESGLGADEGGIDQAD